MTLFFNEAEAMEDTENRNTEITVEQYKRKQKTGCFDKLPENIETYTRSGNTSTESCHQRKLRFCSGNRTFDDAEVCDALTALSPRAGIEPEGH